ncbi:dGTP triphosphohydrolase [Clostridium cellulovorans]|uniref:Deoxyguanosinetriphosphate triphosphohydrolase n=1 Tax=Clostridium cellulovorans (strain ATCC 35296 / DSM 3052 / OCM 3 / 743B) TaxID=573061 RepID=D9SWI4_CLOC7|nr:deoxyguanosinetriphosphate triphosphohydrolase [Clostridium cellulovorans 743B]
MGILDIGKLIEFRDVRMKEYAQCDKESDRKVKFSNKQSSGKSSGYNNMFLRNEFSRDRDRIKYSRAFRRLEHKAQIFSHEKGDHYRTRLTHTLEVSQIARSLARNMNLNEDLVEAIALGHDIGHTPFGHQGERTLDDIMSGKDNLTGKIRYRINYGGFKHNFHSLKILDQLEVKHKKIKGMNLTWQVMDGILKHTRIKRHKVCKEKCGGCWDIDRFLGDASFIKELLDYNFAVTLEGQIVAIADEIAQRQHDFDDGLRDTDLNLNFETVATYLMDEFDKINLDDDMYSRNLDGLISSMEKLIEVVRFERTELYQINTLVRNLIDFFIKDVTMFSLDTLMKNKENITNLKDDRVMFTKKIVDFSPIGQKVNEIIEKYIKIKILNSYNVSRFDGKAIHVIRELFKAYYKNPRQMPEYILTRLASKVREVSENIYDIMLSKELSAKNINFIDNSPEEINKLVKLMKLEITMEDVFEANEIIAKLRDSIYVDNSGNLIENKLIKINREDKENLNEEELFIKATLEIHYAYLSTICDYIAGMTDNYASSEFKSLYLIE